jgi:hypothetical protein
MELHTGKDINNDGTVDATDFDLANSDYQSIDGV